MLPREVVEESRTQPSLPPGTVASRCRGSQATTGGRSSGPGLATVVLCRSADRRSKQQAMRDKLSRRIEVALERLATRISRSKRRLDREQVNRQICRILQQNQACCSALQSEFGEEKRPCRSASRSE